MSKWQRCHSLTLVATLQMKRTWGEIVTDAPPHLTKRRFRLPLCLSVHRISANVHRLSGRLGRAVALALAVIVLGLAILTTSPIAHAWLHADAHDSNHVCAVTLYVQGTTVPLTVVSVPLIVWRQVDIAAPGGETSVRAAPSHRLPPGCGPPWLGGASV